MIVVQVLPLAKSIPWKITNMTLNKNGKTMTHIMAVRP